MAIESICSGCGKKLAVAEEHAGKQARCPACGQVYTIPMPAPDGGMPTESDQSGGEPAGSSLDGNDSDLAATVAGSGSAPGGADEATQQFWMLTEAGQEYGPVDRASLNRWFSEGRVGPGYKVRQGEMGGWQPADVFRPYAQAQNANPYSDNPQAYQTPMSQPVGQTYSKADQGGLILAMGILSFFLCPIFGIVAWVMGGTALKDIQAGRADPKSKGLVQVGYYLGIVSVILNILCIGGYIILIAVMLVADGM